MFTILNPFQAIMDEARIQQENFCWLEESENGVGVYYTLPSKPTPNFFGELQGRGWVENEPCHSGRNPDGECLRLYKEPKLTTERLKRIPLHALPRVGVDQKDRPLPIYPVELEIHPGSARIFERIKILVNGTEVAYLRETGHGPRLGLDTGTGGEMLRLGLGLDRQQYLLVHEK